MRHHASSARGFRAAAIESAIAETFETELLPSLLDPVLEDLHVVRVEAAGNLATICVVLAPGTREFAKPSAEVEDALARCRNRLRGELAERVRLKRVPALQLRYLPLPLWERKGGGE